MQTKVLNLKRVDTGAKPDHRHATTAGGIARRDREQLSSRARKCKGARPRGIADAKIAELVEELSIYPEGKREHVFKARVVRHDQMFKLVGVQAKIFNQWLTRGKVPYAEFCIFTGRKGYPPKAYLEEEALSLVTSLNTHYREHFTFRDTDNGLRANVHAGINLARTRKANEIGYARSC